MTVTGGEGDHARQAADRHRNRIRSVVVADRAIAQLAVVVPPPGPDRAVALQGQAVTVTGGEGDHPRQAADRHRGQAVSGAAAVPVPPPGPDRAIALQGQAVIVTGGEGDHTRQAADLDRGYAASGAAITQLAVVVSPPGPDRAIALQGQAVRVAGGEGDHTRQAADLHRGRAVGGAAIAQLAVLVIPPGPDCAVAVQGEGVMAARHHACTGEIGRHGLICRAGSEGAGAARAVAVAAHPTDEAGGCARSGGQRHRCTQAIAAGAGGAAVDAGGRAVDGAAAATRSGYAD